VRAEQVRWVYSGAPGDPREDAANIAALDGGLGCQGFALTSLAPLVGCHAGLGALHVAAACWTGSTARLPGIATLVEPLPRVAAVAVGPGLHPVAAGPGLVHAVARRGDQVALVVASA
jgi:hypothetical protein